jgi:hypothetical protein
MHMFVTPADPPDGTAYMVAVTADDVVLVNLTLPFLRTLVLGEAGHVYIVATTVVSWVG